MVLKRKLPSKLTQPNPKEDGAKPAEDTLPPTTDFSADPPVQATPPPFSDDPSLEPAAPEASTSQPAPSASAAPAREMAPSHGGNAEPASMGKDMGSLKRKKKKPKRLSQQSNPTSTPREEKTIIDDVKAATEEPDTSPLMSDAERNQAAPKHFDGSDRVEAGLKDIRGELKDPAQDKLEAAYSATPVESDMGFSPDVPDLPDLAPIGLETSFEEPPIAASTSDTPKSETIPIPPEPAAPPMPAPTMPDLDVADAATKSDDIKPEPAPTAPTFAGEPPAVPDIFANVTLETPTPVASEKETSSAQPTGPEAQKEDNQAVNENKAPELPGSMKSAIASSRRSPIGGALKLAVVAVVVLLGIVAWVVLQGQGEGQTANRVGQAFVSLSQPPQTTDILPPPDAAMPTTPPPAPTQPVTMAEDESSEIAIDFVDVDPVEADQPIIADDVDEMPEEIGAIARFQREVSRQKALKEGRSVTTDEEEDVVTEPQVENVEEQVANLPTKEQIEAELAAYRAALASAESPEELPKPGEFMGRPDGRVAMDVQAPAVRTDDNVLAPPELENPYNLPVISQPENEAAQPAVRTLSDFDLAAFEPDEDRVRIPRGVRPRLSAANFPTLEVLSFVPDRGIIATNRGREGVLLIGESVEGWELVAVYNDYAEFNNGTRKYTLVRPN